jgi:hypothetical protein
MMILVITTTIRMIIKIIVCHIHKWQK